jgi:hypothetical protein
MDLLFFDAFAALAMQRLLLRELQPQDAPAHLEVCSDPEVTRCDWKGRYHDRAGSRSSGRLGRLAPVLFRLRATSKMS